MGLTEVAAGTWRLESMVGPRIADLCRHADERLGPFGADPANLSFAVHGHVRRMLRTGRARIERAGERSPRYARP